MTDLATLEPSPVAQDLFDNARSAAEMMKALSHETRLMILCILVDGEQSVGQIERTLDLPQSTVSQQLARLRHDRLVETRRDGRVIYYRIASDDTRRLIALLYDLFCKDAKA